MVCEYTQVEPLLLRKCNNLKPCLVKLSSNDITVLSLLFDPGLMQFLIILADFNSFRQLLYCSLRKVLWGSFRVQTRALAARTEGRGSRFCKYSIWIWTSYVPWWVRPLIEVSWKRRGGGGTRIFRDGGGGKGGFGSRLSIAARLAWRDLYRCYTTGPYSTGNDLCLAFIKDILLRKAHMVF